MNQSFILSPYIGPNILRSSVHCTMLRLTDTFEQKQVYLDATEDDAR